MCSTITTTRKFFTVLVSIFSFEHQMGMIQWVAVSMVFAGLVVELYGESQKKYNKNDEAPVEEKPKSS
jgi:UDP-galactose transporter B1